MRTLRALSGLTILVGLILAATPWLLHFRRDHVAFLDVLIGGAVVGVLGLVTTYMARLEPAPRSPR
jgi:SPW repeat